ncbi:MAG: M10 family metallopeptidase C-terminal domain-containing protein [Pseudomonadota bacterium]
MAIIEFVLDSVELPNGNILQMVGELSTVTGDNFLRFLLIDGTDGSTILSFREPDGPLQDNDEPRQILALEDGGFGIVFESSGLVSYLRFDAAGQPVGDAIPFGLTEDGGDVVINSLRNVIDLDGQGRAFVIESQSTPTDPGAEGTTVIALHIIAPDGSVDTSVEVPQQTTLGNGFQLDDGTFVLYSVEDRFFPFDQHPDLIATVYDAHFHQIGQSQTRTENVTERGSGGFSIGPVKQASLQKSNVNVVAWAQPGAGANSGNLDQTAIFIGFGAKTGLDQRLTNITRIAPDEAVLDNFELLALPDGSFILGWTQELDTDTPQVVWQQFDDQGNALSPITDIDSVDPIEFGVVLDLLGDQLLVTSAALDTTNEGTVLTRQSFDLELEPFSEFDDVFTGAETSETLDGQAGDDQIDASGGDDVIIGGDGDDSIDAGEGNDTINGGEGADQIDGGAGIDTADYSDATQRVRVDLQGSLAGLGDAARDALTSIENILGGRRNDDLRGDGGANEIDGGLSSDQVHGRAGDDILNGGRGADKLYGNAGGDVMSGGPGTDRFIYFRASDSQADNRDTITDFETGERIEISRLDANIGIGGNQTFEFIATAGFSGDGGELRFFQSVGGNRTVIQADIDGDSEAEFEIALNGLIALSANDFVL